MFKSFPSYYRGCCALVDLPSEIASKSPTNAAVCGFKNGWSDTVCRRCGHVLCTYCTRGLMSTNSRTADTNSSSFTTTADDNYQYEDEEDYQTQMWYQNQFATGTAGDHSIVNQQGNSAYVGDHGQIYRGQHEYYGNSNGEGVSRRDNTRNDIGRGSKRRQSDGKKDAKGKRK